MRQFTPTWNPKKEILLGTQEKVNPTRTIARRMAKVSIKLAEKSPLYFALLDRFQFYKSERRWCARWKIREIAERLDKSEKTIDRWLASLDREGWIKREHTSNRGLNSYCVFILLPINDLIQDFGVEQRRVTDVPASGSRMSPQNGAKEKTEETQLSASSSSVSSSSHPQAAKQAEAGRGLRPPTPAAAAGFATRGEGDESSALSSLDAEMIQFLRDHEAEILATGFKPRSIPSLLKDMKGFFDGDEEKWQAFKGLWPALMVKLRGSGFLKTAQKSIGFGWLFQPNTHLPDEENVLVILNSNQYDGVKLPSTLYDPGEEVLAYGRPSIILGRVGDSLRRYRVCASRFAGTPSQEEESYTVSIEDIRDMPKPEEVGA